VFGKEYLQSVELLRYTFDVIQAIDSYNDLYPFEPLLKRGNPFFHGRLGQVLKENGLVYQVAFR
jgi:hypothetical protein